MGTPSITLGYYTFPFAEINAPIDVFAIDENGDDDGRVRSVELEAINGVSNGFYLTLEGEENVLLNIPPLYADKSEVYRKIPLRFVIGYIDVDKDEFDKNGLDYYEEDDLTYKRVDVNVFATVFGKELPTITYVENLASRVDEAASVVVHGTNMTDGLSIKLTNGETEYVVPPEDIEFEIDKDGVGTATFTVYPGMLATDGNGSEPCAQYNIYFSYGDQVFGDPSIGLIRYKYDSETDEQQRYSTEGVTIEKECYKTGSMSLVYDSVDENGNAVLNAAADPRFGNDIYFKIDPDTKCTDYFYTMVRLKYNKNLTHKAGLLKLNGIQLMEGDVVWLARQTVESENGLWLVQQGNWKGFNENPVRLYYSQNIENKYGLLELDGVQLNRGDVVYLSNQAVVSDNGYWTVRERAWKQIDDCGVECHRVPTPMPVDDKVLVDLGARASYPVDYVCRDNVPYKCGSRTICNYKVSPGNVVALLNQENGEDGIYLVTCSNWIKLSDVLESDVKGTTVDFTSRIIVQNDIDFCKCGGIFHIDYYFLTPSCYMHHLQRSVKIICAGASIAPNDADHQFRITEYQIRVGEEDALIGNNGRTPGDPVKETCVVDNEDFDYDFGLSLIEHRQFVQDPQCIQTPMCDTICDVPRIYNLRMPAGYSNSNDRNGFTIKFWRLEEDGWHLYAYVASGTQMTGMDYYVYHLHVKGKATEAMVDVNEHDWFSETTGVIAGGDYGDAFGICDDTWEFMIGYDEDGKPVTRTGLDSETLYMPWRISCTTNLFAHSYPHSTLRTSCLDMADAAKTVDAVGDMCEDCEGTGLDPDTGATCPTCDGTGKNPEGYLVGMSHLFGVAYYTTTMSKSQFVAEYNQYDPNCIWYSINEVLVTDEDGEAYTYDGNPIHTPIETDDSTENYHEALRR